MLFSLMVSSRDVKMGLNHEPTRLTTSSSRVGSRKIQLF